MSGSLSVVGPRNNSVRLRCDSVYDDAYKKAQPIARRITNRIYDGKSVAVDMMFNTTPPSRSEAILFSSNQNIKEDASLIGFVTNNTGSITRGTMNAYPYVVVGDYDPPFPFQSDLSELFEAKIVGGGKKNTTVLAGRTAGTTYVAQGESGEVINTAGKLFFTQYTSDQNKVKGNWSIYSSNGDDSISTTNGNNTVNAGLGKNKIFLGSGRNAVKSEGQDTITASRGGNQTVTLFGGQSKVTLGNGNFVIDASNNNEISMGENGTVNGGLNGIINFGGGNKSVLQGGSNNTISASSNVSLKIVHGNDNHFNIDGNMTFLNGDGNINAAVSGQAVIFGAQELNFNFSQNESRSNSSGLFVADKGNETLNASNYNNTIQIYANTVSGAQSNLKAFGTNNHDDILVSGSGNSTFTGGGGNNLFMFTKTTNTNGNTVITDFSASTGNKIAFINYNFNNDSLTQLLQNAQNDGNGNTLINLDNHHITLQNIAASDLHNEQFIVMNKK